MAVQQKFVLLKCLAVAAAAFGALSAGAVPVTHYSVASVNSSESVNDGIADRVVDFTGGPVQSQASGSRALAYGNGLGGVLVNTETSSVFAQSDLGTGALKSATSLGLGTVTFGALPLPGTRYATARSTAEFADQFRLYSGGAPFVWASDTEVSFSMAVTGLTDIPASVPVPPDTNLTWANLRLNVYKLGTLDLIDQASRIELFPGGIFDNDAYQLWLALLNQVTASSLHSSGWCLGDSRTPSDFCGGSFYQNVALIGGEALVDHLFTPGEDFEWILSLETQVRLDLSLQNTAVAMDFGNTVNVGFNAPAGTEVVSGSGIFPGTLAVIPSPNGVPEPSSLALCALALMIMGTLRRELGALMLRATPSARGV